MNRIPCDNAVFVLDTLKQPQPMVPMKRAQELLLLGKAAVFRREPYTLILKHEVPVPRRGPERYTLKIDPGSRYTGFAIVNGHNRVVFAMELEHRGESIKLEMTSRASIRRSRRGRNTRYRKARFDNRTRSADWLPPSIEHRVLTSLTWIKRFMRSAPITDVAIEVVKFDMELLRMDADVLDHVEQAIRRQSVLAYLLLKHNGKCVYCDTDKGPFTKDHWHPKSKGGTDNLSNFVLACYPCNQAKSNLPPEVFLRHDPERFQRLEALCKVNLKDAAAVNTTRKRLPEAVLKMRVKLECSDGGRTAYNRKLLGLPKTHWIDAACVGRYGSSVNVPLLRPLLVKAMGHGHRQVTRVNAYGFPCTKAKSTKSIHTPVGLVRTGDMVDLDTHRGKYAGTYPAMRIVSINTTTGYLRACIQLPEADKAQVVDFHPSAVRKVLQRNDGYRYAYAA